MPIPVAGAPQQQPQAAVRLGQTPPNQQGTHLPPGTRPPVPLGSLVNFVGQQPPSSASASPQLRPQANAAAPSLLAHPPTVQPIRTVQPQAQRPSASPPQQRAPVPQRPALAKAGKPSGSVAIDVGYSPPPANISTFFHACSDYHPLLSKRSEYFQPDIPYDPNAVVLGSLTPSHSNVPRVRSDSVTSPAVIRDIISVVVPCFTESARNLKHTLYDLWRMQREMHKNSTFFEFHVCLILDGWSKAPSSLKAYIHTLFQSEAETGPAKMQAYAKQFEKDVRREEMRANKTPKTPAQAPTANGSAVVSSDSSSSDSSSSSDDDESSSEDDRKAEVKFLKPSSTEERGQMKAFSPLARASAGSYTRSTTNSATKSVEVEDDEGSGLNFPESASFDLFSSQSASTSDAFGGGATGKAAAGKTNSGPARTWEKYISNWSADSDLNPPLQPETLIIQKWITHDGLPAGVQANGNGIKSGHATTIRSIAAIPIFHESDFTANETVSSDPEELRRKKEARLKLTVIVKRDNRRKHNSHEWFLRGRWPVRKQEAKHSTLGHDAHCDAVILSLGFAPVYTTKLNASTTSPSGVQLIFMTDAGSVATIGLSSWIDLCMLTRDTFCDIRLERASTRRACSRSFNTSSRTRPPLPVPVVSAS
jgi:hypothetical protein